MSMVFYILGSLAALLLIVATLLLSVRALSLMARLEDTRKDLAKLIIEGTLSLQHANRSLARSQETLERLGQVAERGEKILTLLQPAAAVGHLFAGARRVLGGPRADTAEHDAKEKRNG